MITDVVDEWWKVHDHNPDTPTPGGIFNKYGPRGEIIDTTTDHRMLWHIRDELLGAPPYLREAFELLNSYLAATCQHHWGEYPAEPGIDAFRQCLWCNSVEWHEES